MAADTLRSARVFVANILFSSLGNGAATRAGTVVVFLAFGFLGFRLLQKGGPTTSLARATEPAEPV